MSYTALYRKYRPSNFSNVVGQDVIVKILRNSIKSNLVSHAYLFTGPRGTGKTSVAKIFAHAVNCLNFEDDICNKCDNCLFLEKNDADIIEIDAASNNGVDEIRTLRDNVKLLPTFCKYKIYIIDEVHMLSTGAFNALLKTLEEPPAHVIFILATTEPHKIPLTILSRCQRFDFNKIDEESLINRLNYIIKCENKEIDDDIVKYIAKIADGGLRDAINLLDQTLSLDNPDVTIDELDKISGHISNDKIFTILDNILFKNYADLLTIINDISKDGIDYNNIVNNMLIIIRDISINMQIPDYFEQDYSKILSKYNINSEVIINLAHILNELLIEMKNSNDQKILFEIYMMQISSIINNNEGIDGNYQQENEVREKNMNNEVEKDEFINDKENELMQVETNDQSKIEKDNKDNAEFLKLKEIRINNSLYGANKEILNHLLSNYDNINDFISNKSYNTIAALLMEAQIKVASKDYLLFSFRNESYISVFDLNYQQIEKFLHVIYNESYKVVAVSENEWLKIKEKFIFNKKNNISYVFIEENDVKLKESSNITKVENSALEIFGDDTISVR